MPRKSRRRGEEEGAARLGLQTEARKICRAVHRARGHVGDRPEIDVWDALPMTLDLETPEIEDVEVSEGEWLVLAVNDATDEQLEVPAGSRTSFRMAPAGIVVDGKLVVAGYHDPEGRFRVRRAE